ncbi:MAG: glycosyltransferase [Solirubrobacteraceae bacterium]
MARVLAYTSPARSHLFPLTPILDELHERGHEVVLRTLDSQIESMQQRGFAVTPIDPRIEAIEHEDWRTSNPRESLRLNVKVFCARAEHDAPDLTRAIAETSPDVVLVDFNCWGSLMAAESWGGPWAAFCPYPLPLPSKDAPPYGPGLAPARGPLGHLRDGLIRRVVLSAMEGQMRPAINRIRAQSGLTAVGSAEEWMAGAPLLLSMTAEPFEYPRRDWPENVVMVGPCAWDPPADPPPWLEQTTSPIVLVNTSTEFQDDGRLVQVALEALAEEPVTVVATLPAGDPTQFEAPANSHVERFIPHGAILERAACAITHGGMGSTQKALSHGVPVCAVPFGRDQLEVARRVEVAQAGTRLPARRLSPARLRRNVREAMTMTDGAKRIAAAYTATGGAHTAADALEARLLRRESA